MVSSVREAGHPVEAWRIHRSIGMDGTTLVQTSATSAPEEELGMLREVLDSDHLVYAVTSSEDADTAKPEPDIVEITLERAGVTPRTLGRR